MKTITSKEFLERKSCYIYLPKKEKIIDLIEHRHKEWSALDILALDEISAASRIHMLIYSGLLDDGMLNEFACRCADRTLIRIENPDPKCVSAIEVKRRWINGKATDEELESARDSIWNLNWLGWQAVQAAMASTAIIAARDGAEASASAIAESFSPNFPLEEALDIAFEDEWNQQSDIYEKIFQSEREWQIDELKRMLEA